MISEPNSQTTPSAPVSASTPPAPAPQPFSARQGLGVVGLVVAALFLLLGLCGLVFYIIGPLQAARNALVNNATLGAFVALALMYGAIFALIAGPAAVRRLSPRFLLPSSWLFVLLFALVVVVGQLVLVNNLAPAWLFPPWHVLASAMIPLAVLAFASHRLPVTNLPTVLGEFSWGGLGTLLPAVVLELVIGFVLLLAGIIVIVFGVGPARLQALTRQLQPLLQTNQPDISQLVQSLSHEPLLIGIIAIGTIIFLSGVVPLVEETLKSLGPALAIGRWQPEVGHALLFGIAAGAGYALSENLLNGAGSVSTQSGTACLWGPVIILRGGTSLMHIATTATTSVGWHAGLVEKRWGRFFLFFIPALLAHGAWNLIALVLGFAMGINDSRLCQDPAGILTNFGSLGSLALLVLLLIAASAWIAWLVNWARAEGFKKLARMQGA